MKPILFSTPIVQAILDGRKTQTRRVANIKIPLRENSTIGTCTFNDTGFSEWENGSRCLCQNTVKPIYKVGDILYVREAWGLAPNMTLKNIIADDLIFKTDKDARRVKKWKPSIHMPKTHARLFLKVTNVRVERLQDITFEDIFNEGFNGKIADYFINTRYKDPAITATTPKEKEILNWWINLWNSINGEDAWKENPYVFVYEFARISKEESTHER